MKTNDPDRRRAKLQTQIPLLFDNQRIPLGKTIPLQRAKLLSVEAELPKAHNDLGQLYITTFTGQRFHFLTPEAGDINIEDVAHALSMICRFTGHCKEFYSVAEHSVHVANLCENPLEGLLHEAEEAYMNDLSSPLKKLLPDYRQIQEGIRGRVCKTFGLKYPFSEDLKDADWAQLKTEARHLMEGVDWLGNFPTRRKRGIIPQCLSPRAAKKLFLDTYKDLV